MSVSPHSTGGSRRHHRPHGHGPRSPKSVLILAVLSLLLAALTSLHAAPHPNPQVLPTNLPLPPVTGQNPPGNGNNNNNDRPTTPAPSRTATPSSGAASQQQPTPTATPDTECKTGRCKVPARQNAECISLERTDTCKQFVGLYVPVDVRPYFDQAFPKKKPAAIPAPLESGEHFNTVYSTQNYSYPTRYIQTFMLDKVGCTSPNQLFYQTSFCWDLFQYFRDVAKHPCSALGPAPKVCQSTLDERADSLIRDLNNGTACPVGQSARDLGTKFANDLKRHPFASSESGCIAGIANEMPFGHGNCGYTDEMTACDNGCKGIDANRCAKLRNDLAALGKNVPQPPLCDENDRVPCAKGLPIGYIVLIVIGVGVVIGLATLFWTRRRVDRAELMKEEPMTLARPAAAANEPLLASNAAAPDATTTAAQPQQPAMAQQQQPSLSPPQPAALTAGGMAAATTSTASAAAPPPLSPPSPSTAAIAPIPPQCTGVDATEATVAKVRGGFPGTQDGELALLAGDLVTVHNRFADGWALGTRHPTHGRPALTGYFPAAYLIEADVAQVPRRADSLRRPVR